ncbi:hypothetical protein EDD59_11154 [Muricomes intestini]|uniref:Phage protein n=1 Tax=Muricomes intestini TaxID=1796634 RepID=A0A4R3K6R5_9FIRM|nr:hypothetical protein [Muricomes intestini]TCS78529.1 hypothetical protein EDD59_11154 [Muricomes intestini]
MKFRKKPVVVEAFCFKGADSEINAPDWFAQALQNEKAILDRALKDGHAHVYGCTIDTLEGKMHARIGDYIIRGVNGELYPCKPDTFRKTYEAVEVRGGMIN